MTHSGPNILFIMSDDHASHAISAYGSRINTTPHIDRVAKEGMRFDNCFCTNSICTPSRASILTGTYNHINGVTTLSTHLDRNLLNYPKILQQKEYQTAVIGKWHLGPGENYDPSGFDYWNILPGQGLYHDPEMIEMGVKTKTSGYVTDLITDYSLQWLSKRDRNRPFCLMVHHKAPHRPWEPDEKHASMYESNNIPEPDTFNDNYANRANAALNARMRVDRDLNSEDLKKQIPENLSPAAEKSWKYQRYIKDYLRCIASIDDNVGRLLDYIDEEGIRDNTLVVYTSDQGFFLGDHGWYDKRFMYEESLRMPLLIRYPKEIIPGTDNQDIVLNVDFPATFLDCAEIEVPSSFQGNSFRSLMKGNTPSDWQQSMYYRYWMHGAHHNVPAHYGVRTLRYKLIYYYGDPLGQEGTVGSRTYPEWELFDLEQDPNEMVNVYSNPSYKLVVKSMQKELQRLQRELGDKPYNGETNLSS